MCGGRQGLRLVTVNILKIRKSKVRKLAAIFPRRSKNSIYWATLKFGRTSNSGKGGTPLEMSSDIEITAFLRWEFYSSVKHTISSPILGFHTSL